MDSYEKDLRAEDIPLVTKTGEASIWRKVADRFGTEVVLFISKEVGGDRVQYIPEEKQLLRAARLRAFSQFDDREL
jgi:hypothetical protein